MHSTVQDSTVIHCSIRASDELAPLLKLMGVLEALPQVIGFVQWGWASGWFGLACPAHCQGSWVLLGLAFLSGISAGALLAFCLSLWIYRRCPGSLWPFDFWAASFLGPFGPSFGPARAAPKPAASRLPVARRMASEEAEISSAITEVQLALERLDCYLAFAGWGLCC